MTPDPASGTAELIELKAGPVAHGGHCVARHEGRVVFVRHTLPGERVLARLTESEPGARFWRADAVQILDPSPDRVPPPCPLSGPDACGGCDWQHVRLAAQRDLKAAVLTEQLQRLAGLTPGADGVPQVVVEAADDNDGLGWRTRMRFTLDDDGNTGLRKHRSHEVIVVPRCPISHPNVQAAGVGQVPWPFPGSVDVIAPADGDERLVIAEPRNPRHAAVPALPGASSAAVRQPGGGLRRLSGRTWVREHVLVRGEDRQFRITGIGFWQVHPRAAQILLDAVLDAAAPRQGERIADLYCGAGLFATGLAIAAGPGGTVVAIESDERAVRDARRSLHDLPQIEVWAGDVAVMVPRIRSAGVVVLDPPRTGAGRRVMSGIASLHPRVIVYVACDPAALARDIAFAAADGYRLVRLRAFDLFPMTHHLECVAALIRPA